MSARPRAALVTATVLLASVATAVAQSRRYPAPPENKDQEADEISNLWEHASEPERAPQARLLAEAKRLILARTPTDLAAAVAKATAAITLRPSEPAAYLLRAVAHESLADWKRCAEDFTKALELDPKAVGQPELRYAENPLLGAGICLARVGRLSEAEQTLDSAVARSPGPNEWLRLAETRIAMGKLREGLDALDASTEATGESTPAIINSWLRALAYDRARQTAMASETLATLAATDRFLRQLTNPALPFLSKAEELYLLALGWEGIGRPELSLAYYRAAAATKGSEIWRQRLREHIEALEELTFPAEVLRSGPAKLEPEVALAAVRKAMPRLVACVERLPTAAFTIRVTRSRPVASATSGITSAPPAAGVTVSADVALGEELSDAISAAESCIKEIAGQLDLPPIKEANTWHYLTFSLVAHRLPRAPAKGARPPTRTR